MRDGYVSVDGARSSYGVAVTRDGSGRLVVDRTLTDALRGPQAAG